MENKASEVIEEIVKTIAMQQEVMERMEASIATLKNRISKLEIVLENYDLIVRSEKQHKLVNIFENADQIDCPVCGMKLQTETDEAGKTLVYCPNGCEALNMEDDKAVIL